MTFYQDFKNRKKKKKQKVLNNTQYFYSFLLSSSNNGGWLYLGEAPKSLQMVIAAMKLKDA